MAANEKNKDDLQRHIQDLEGSVRDLEARRQVLENELTETTAGVENKAQAMGEAVLAGRDPKKEHEALTREKTRLDTCRQAIALACSKLSALGAEIAESKAELAELYFDQTADEFRAQLLVCINRLYSAAADFDALESKFDELTELRQICDIDINQLPSPDVRNLGMMFRRMNTYIEGTIPRGIRRMLESFEQQYPALMAQGKKRQIK